MTLRAVTLIAVLSILAVPLAPQASVARASSVSAVAVAAQGVPAAVPTAARLGRGFGRGFGARPSTRVRSRSPLRRPARRPLRRPGFGHTARNVLRLLGIAWLVHALFGWGAGGSPFGLLLVLAFVAWIATRRRRRPAWDARRGAF